MSIFNFKNFIFSQADHNILWFEVCMNYFTHPVHIVKTYEALSCKLAHKRERHTFVIVTLDNLKEVYSKDFKNHYKVFSIGTVMNKGIEQLCTMRGVPAYAILR